MREQRYSELKYEGKIINEQWKIDEILIKNKFNWLVNAEIKNARIEIFQDTLVWNAGIWYNGDWYFGVWRDGEWRYGTWQNGVWYNGVWKDGIFKSGIIYKGKFFKGKIESGEIRGGQFINIEIDSKVTEYTGDEYQAQQEEQERKTQEYRAQQQAQVQAQAQPDKVKFHSSHQAQTESEPLHIKLKESMKHIKTFESFSNEELNEGFRDILDKVVNYGKKGALTAAMLLSLAASPAVQAAGKSDDVITIGVKHIYKIENQNLNAALAAIANRYTQICLNEGDEEMADSFIKLKNYYLNLRDGFKTQLTDDTLNCQKILLNSLDKFINEKNKTSIMTLIDEGMNLDNDSYKFN